MYYLFICLLYIIIQVIKNNQVIKKYKKLNIYIIWINHFKYIQLLSLLLMFNDIKF